VSIPVSRRIFGGALLAGTGALAVQRMRRAGLVPDRRRARSRVAILHETSYASALAERGFQRHSGQQRVNWLANMG